MFSVKYYVSTVNLLSGKKQNKTNNKNLGVEETDLCWLGGDMADVETVRTQW